MNSELILKKLQLLSNRTIIIAIIGFSSFLFLTALAFRSSPPETTSVPKVKPKIAATIFPLYDLVRNVAGDEFEVILILPPGANPHVFEPTPADIAKISEVKMIFAIGHNLDNWALPLAEAATESQVVTVDRGIPLLESTHSEESSEVEIH